MNILLINGSPRGEKSNTLCLAKAFCQGLAEQSPSEEKVLNVYGMNIRDCTGCFACWSKTPGTCIIKDDMAEVIEQLLWAQIVVWSFPLYYSGTPSRLKALIDRQLPMNLPFMTPGAGSGGHPSRYDHSHQRYVVISTCGFYTFQGNYDAVSAQFNHMYGKGGYTPLYCGQGELFHKPTLRQRTDEYLGWVKKAGAEFAHGSISAETRAVLDQPLFPRKIFEQWADASWGVEPGTTEKADPALIFTKQMAALYTPSAWKGKDLVVELAYTDVGKTYQLLLQKDGYQVLDGEFSPYTTRIETPLEVWEKIARGELNGSRAMMDRLYTVKGDFQLMLHWDDYFGAAALDADSKENPKGNPKPGLKQDSNMKSPNMALMLLPWLALWIFLPIHASWGGTLAVLLSASLSLAGLRWQPTPFEGVSALGVSGMGAWALLGGPVRLLLPLSYLAFGVMWTTTAFLPLPLSAYYSSSQYGGERAKSNPLFLRTNRILTACWGILYLLAPVWTYFLLETALGRYSGAINSIPPLLMGGFTAWFQRWYPRHYAVGRTSS